MIFLSVRGYGKTVNCQGKSGKRQESLKWMISGNPGNGTVGSSENGSKNENGNMAVPESVHIHFYYFLQ